MSTGLLGKKLGMTSVFSHDGKMVPVTVVKVGPCIVTQIKRTETDGYNALQVGFEEKPEKKVNKPEAGHFEKSGGKGFRNLREFRVDDPDAYQEGQVISIEEFSVGDTVNISGTSKGKGFQGTIKRHGFSRGPETHGNRNHRKPGSVGMSAWPARIVKGKKMPGHMGNKRETVKNLKIVDIKPEENVILLKGPVPGPKTGVIEVKKSV
ncbi:MAG: 50S ribosomal protein L3 [Desulfobacteraceae bacterium]